jgi:hypothetical protein
MRSSSLAPYPPHLPITPTMQWSLSRDVLTRPEAHVFSVLNAPVKNPQPNATAQLRFAVVETQGEGLPIRWSRALGSLIDGLIFSVASGNQIYTRAPDHQPTTISRINRSILSAVPNRSGSTSSSCCPFLFHSITSRGKPRFCW